MKRVTVIFNEDTFTITELPTTANEAWRKRMMSDLSTLVDSVSGLADIELETAEDVVNIVKSLSSRLFELPGTLRNLIFEYSPQLEESLGENVFDSDVMVAFLEVLQLAFPFGGLMDRLKVYFPETGSAVDRMLQSYASLNGASPKVTVPTTE